MCLALPSVATSLFCISALVMGCGSSAPRATLSPTTREGFADFKKVPDDKPVISSGSRGWPTFMADPCVIKDEEGYHAFFTNLFFKRNGRPCLSYDPQRQDEFDTRELLGTVAYAFSSDRGLTWTLRQTPCVMPGPESWNNDALETPFVLKDGGRLLLFYSALGSRDGKKFRSRYQIGAASLELGGRTIRERLLDESVQFTKAKEPVLPHNTTSVDHDNNTQEPSVVLRDGKFELFYIGLTLKKPDQQIPGVSGQAITKVAMYKAVLDRDLHVVRAVDEALINNANITEVHYRDGVYHVFSTKSPPWYADYPGRAEQLDRFHHNERITYYRSVDGTTWSKAVTLLERGPEDSFDNWGIMAPTVVFENDHAVMFYTAWQIGNQTMTPLPPDGRFGLRHGQEKTIWGNLGRAEAAYKPVVEHPADR